MWSVLPYLLTVGTLDVFRIAWCQILRDWESTFEAVSFWTFVATFPSLHVRSLMTPHLQHSDARLPNQHRTLLFIFACDNQVDERMNSRCWHCYLHNPYDLRLCLNTRVDAGYMPSEHCTKANSEKLPQTSYIVLY